MNPKVIGDRIKILINNRGIKRSYLAKKLKISYNTLTNKLNGKSEFSAIQMSMIKDLLNLDDELSINIFFNPDFNINDDKDLM